MDQVDSVSGVRRAKGPGRRRTDRSCSFWLVLGRGVGEEEEGAHLVIWHGVLLDAKVGLVATAWRILISIFDGEHQLAYRSRRCTWRWSRSGLSTTTRILKDHSNVNYPAQGTKKPPHAPTRGLIVRITVLNLQTVSPPSPTTTTKPRIPLHTSSLSASIIP